MPWPDQPEMRGERAEGDYALFRRFPQTATLIDESQQASTEVRWNPFARPPDADLGGLLVPGGRLNAKPALKSPLPLGELLRRYRAEHSDG